MSLNIVGIGRSSCGDNILTIVFDNDVDLLNGPLLKTICVDCRHGGVLWLEKHSSMCHSNVCLALLLYQERLTESQCHSRSIQLSCWLMAFSPVVSSAYDKYNWIWYFILIIHIPARETWLRASQCLCSASLSEVLERRDDETKRFHLTQTATTGVMWQDRYQGIKGFMDWLDSCKFTENSNHSPAVFDLQLLYSIS